LAGVAVAVEDITAGERDFLVRNADVVTQADNTGKGELRVNVFTVMFDPFCFAFD
jgi:hypothetical protein